MIDRIMAIPASFSSLVLLSTAVDAVPKSLSQPQWYFCEGCIYDVFVTSIIGRGRETPRMPRGHLWMKWSKAIYNINCLFLHVQTKTFKHGSGIESSYVGIQSSYRFTLNVPNFGQAEINLTKPAVLRPRVYPGDCDSQVLFGLSRFASKEFPYN